MNTAIVKKENIIPALTVGPFVVTSTGLVLNSEPTWDEWQAFFDGMQRLGDFRQWNIGDALKAVQIQYGEAAEQLTANYPEYEYGALRQYRWVSENIQYVTRVSNLSWTHHRQVAELESKEQKKWLKAAEKNDWTVSKLRNEIKKKQQETLLAGAPEVETVDTNIVLGDALEVDWPASIDLVLTDPPYGLSVNGRSGAREGKGKWDEKNYQELHDFNRTWLKKAASSLRRDGGLIVFGTLHNIFSIGHLLRGLDFYIIRDIVWNKPFIQRAVNPNALVPSHEIILWARKGNRHTCNLTEITRDVWEIQPNSEFGHPTEKPEALIKRLVTMASSPGELIADPFVGSGTVPAIARELKREYWGVEKDERWWKVAQQRVAGRKG